MIVFMNIYVIYRKQMSINSYILIILLRNILIKKTHHLSSSVDMSVFHLNISLNANHRALCQYLQIGSLK